MRFQIVDTYYRSITRRDSMILQSWKTTTRFTPVPDLRVDCSDRPCTCPLPPPSGGWRWCSCAVGCRWSGRTRCPRWGCRVGSRCQPASSCCPCRSLWPGRQTCSSQQELKQPTALTIHSHVQDMLYLDQSLQCSWPLDFVYINIQYIHCPMP